MQQPQERSGLTARELVDELLELSSSIIRPSARHHLEQARARLAESRLNLVLLGEFKRGKSTLANALLGRSIMPTGVVPLTSAVTILRHGPRERLLVRFEDGHDEEHELQRLAEFATETRNPGNRLGVAMTVVEIPAELLSAGVQLVDTPGIGSVHAHNTELARSFLPQVDATLFVLAADQPLTDAERTLIREALERVPVSFFAVNKIDTLDGGDVEEAIEFVRAGIAALLPGREPPELFPVSARTGAGLDKLRARLRSFVEEERTESLERSVLALSRVFAADLAAAARFELHAIELPLEELQRRAELFEQRIAALGRAREEAAALLDRDVRELVRLAIDQPLLEYARDHQVELERRLRDVGKVSPRRLAAQLGSIVDATVEELFSDLAAQYQTEIAHALERIELRQRERIEAVLAETRTIAAEVFGAGAGIHLPDVGLRAPTRFSFKLRDEEQLLEQVVARGQTILPGSLGRRLVRRDAERRLLALVDRHAGRLRSDLVDRVRASVRDYQRELDFAVDEAIESIRAGIERAEREQRSGSVAARGRLRELTRVAARADELAAGAT